MPRLRALQFAACLAVGLTSSAIAAQAFPDKAVTILVGFQAGGPVDSTARIVADQLSKVWGKPVIIDNRPGANGTLAAAFVAKAPADGHTLLMGTRSITMNAALYTKLPYDPKKAFVPIAIAAAQPNVLVVSKGMPQRDLKSLVAAMKQEPDKFTYASTGNGSIPHLAAEMFQKLSGTRLRHVPYKGGSALIVDLLSGRVDMSFAGLGTVIDQVKQGNVIPIAVASDKRSPLLPDVPTFAQAGLTDFNVDTWYGLLAPAGTPPQVIQKINADVNQILQKPDVQQRLAQGGSSVMTVSADSYRKQYDQDLAKYGALIRELKLQND